jgi:tRNA1Val (adenine37-N6)-methyltransferase
MDIFNFKKFSVEQDNTKMKIGTDGVLLGAWTPLYHPKRILDIGTGTGVIALMLAQRNSETIIDAVEIDQSSYLQAKQNFSSSPWHERLNIYHSSIQDYSNLTNWKYDLIVSNPPFFSNSTPSIHESNNLVKHTLFLSHDDLIKSVDHLLLEEGIFSVIIPVQESSNFISKSRDYGLFPRNITRIRSKESKPVTRLLISFSKLAINELILLNESTLRNDRTEAYQKLTEDFYL